MYEQITGLLISEIFRINITCWVFNLFYYMDLIWSLNIDHYSDIAGESRENKPRIYLDEISRQQIQKLTKRVSPYCIYRFVFDFGTWSMCLNTPTDISLIKPINWPHCLLMTYRLRDKRGRSVYSRSTVEFELNLWVFFCLQGMSNFARVLYRF